MISEMVMVPIEGAMLAGDLVVPGPARSVAVLANGGISFRNSPRNRAVGHELRAAGLGTLLLDLLTEREERADAVHHEHRMDIPRLTRRLVAAVDWLDEQPDARGLPVGLLGSGTAAAAALAAAVERPERTYAVVTVAGRPDLAAAELPGVRVPVLFIVPGADDKAVRLHREAADRLKAPHKVHIVTGVSHLLDDPEAMAQVASAAQQWLVAGTDR